MKKISDFFYYLLHDPQFFCGRVYNLFITVLIIFGISITPLNFFSQNNDINIYLLNIYFLIVIFFTIEYVLKIIFVRKMSSFRYLFSYFGIVNLLSILPFYIHFYGIFENLPLFYLGKIIWLLKIGEIYQLEDYAISYFSRKKQDIFRIIEGEVIIKTSKRHPLIYMISMIPIILIISTIIIGFVFFRSYDVIGINYIFFGLAFLVFIFFLKIWITFHYGVIYFTSERILIVEREIFGFSMNEISYEAITNVKPDNSGFFRYVFGYGDIEIETASGDTTKFKYLKKLSIIMQIIAENRKKAIDKHGYIKIGED